MNIMHRDSAPQRDMPEEVAKTVEQLGDVDSNDLARVWRLTSAAHGAAPDASEISSASTRFRRSVSGSTAGDRPTRARTHRQSRRLRLLGASLAAAAVVALAVVLVRPDTSTLTIPRGESERFTLPDGTRIDLGPASSLTYQTGVFANSRRVRLDGEAYFDVAPNADPFEVETFNARVRALGTQFNVRARRGSPDSTTRVSLASGTVDVRARRSGVDVRLRPGEMSEVRGDAEPTTPRASWMAAELSWKNGGFSMFGEPLGVIAAELGRRYDVTVDLNWPALADDTVNVHVPEAESADVVLRDVCSALQCSFRPTADGYVVEASR